MNIRLLKINAMKRFHGWAIMTGDHGTIASFFWMMSVKQIDEIMERQQSVYKRDDWFLKRKRAIVSYERWSIADKLLKYIKKRRERKNEKMHKEHS